MLYVEGMSDVCTLVFSKVYSMKCEGEKLYEHAWWSYGQSWGKFVLVFSDQHSIHALEVGDCITSVDNLPP